MLLAIFLTVISSIPLVPKVNAALREFPSQFFAYYPSTLEVRIDHGIVTSNVPEPYFLPVPEPLKKDMADKNGVDHLVVIDTKTPMSLDQFRTYRSAVWVGKDQVTFYDNQRGVRITPLGPQTNYVVNEQTLHELESQLAPFYKFAPPLMVLAIFVGLMIAFGVNFFYLLFGAILIFLVGRLLFKQRWSYGQSYQIGLHAITLPLLVNTIISLLSFGAFDIPFLQTALMLGVVYVNYKGIKSTPVSVAPTPPPEALS